MSIVHIPSFVEDVKASAIVRGFHVHTERHYFETNSMRQSWEVEMHPAQTCGLPVDMLFTLEVDPRTLLSFTDELLNFDNDVMPGGYSLPISFSWSMPPLIHPPDLLLLATELARVGGTDLPLEISAVDHYQAILDAPQRGINIVTRNTVSLEDIVTGEEDLIDIFESLASVSQYLADQISVWLDEG